MKKILSLGLALALALPLSVSALATTVEVNQNDVANGSKDVKAEITTSISPTYSVSIPGNLSVDFNTASTAFGTIKLTAAQIDPHYAVQVALDASGTLINGADPTKTIAYAIKAGDAAFEKATYETKGDSTDLTVEITQDAWDAAFAGDYSDTVTFTISYVKTNAEP